MPLVDADVKRVTFEWASERVTAAKAVNVMHFDAPTLAPDDLLDAIEASWNAGMFHVQTDECHVSLMKAQSLAAVPVLAEKTPSTAGGAWTGGTASEAIILAASNVVKFTSGLAGRRRRGRIFLPWVSEIAYNDGFIETGAATTVANGWAAFLTDCIAAGAQPVIVSNVGAGEKTNITLATAVRALATQRRRQDAIKGV